mmetsp:Transcript_3181/g.9218  ORF Transcript_3181/g.9218 Transcript_3181/m.9218 type:complete len:361 (-) Transcript_3181:253-1335(-)
MGHDSWLWHSGRYGLFRYGFHLLGGDGGHGLLGVHGAEAFVLGQHPTGNAHGVLVLVLVHGHAVFGLKLGDLLRGEGVRASLPSDLTGLVLLIRHDLELSDAGLDLVHHGLDLHVINVLFEVQVLGKGQELHGVVLLLLLAGLVGLVLRESPHGPADFALLLPPLLSGGQGHSRVAFSGRGQLVLGACGRMLLGGGFRALLSLALKWPSFPVKLCGILRRRHGRQRTTCGYGRLFRLGFGSVRLGHKCPHTRLTRHEPLLGLLLLMQLLQVVLLELHFGALELSQPLAVPSECRLLLRALHQGQIRTTPPGPDCRRHVAADKGSLGRSTAGLVLGSGLDPCKRPVAEHDAFVVPNRHRRR